MKKYTEQGLKKLKKDEILKISSDMNLLVSKKSTISELIPKILEVQKENNEFVGNSTKLDFSNNSQYETLQQPKKQVVMVSIDTFFVQINKSNLLGYFACALIHPVNYETRELARSQRTKDIQHLAPDYLLISDGFSDNISEEQVLIELILTEFDKQNLEKINEKIYLLPYSLPISRVKKLYFANTESQFNSIATANTFQDAFLPEQLFEVWDSQIPIRIDSVGQAKNITIPQNKTIKIDNQHHFDRILGMLAFMKNTELYYSNETYEYSNYSEKYFKILNLINPIFAVAEVGQLDNGNKDYYQALIKPEKYANQSVLQKIVKNVYANETFKKDIFKQILGMPQPEVQKAFELLVGDKTKDCLQLLTKLRQPELILLAFLYRFRDKEGSEKFALKEQLTDLIDLHELGDNMALSRANIVLAVLGLYYGYRSLPKNENISFSDSFYLSLGNKFSIKFKLNSILDRNIIESVYQYCFHNMQGNFDYLPTEQYKPSFINVPNDYEDKSFELFGTPVLRFSPKISKESKTVDSLVELVWDFIKKNSLVQGENLNKKKLNRLLLKDSTQVSNLLNDIKTKIENEFTKH
jgi:hypothetical protein